MLFYIVLFVSIGFIAGLINNVGLTGIVIIATVFFSGVTAGPFAILTFFEVAIGVGLGVTVHNFFTGNSGNSDQKYKPKHKDLDLKW